MLSPFNFRRVSATQIFLLILAFTVIALAVCAPEALARAGGGDSFSSGSSSDSGSGGGGGGGGGDGVGIIIYYIIRLLLVLCVEHPIIGIPLTLFIVAIVIYIYVQSLKESQNRTIRRGIRAINTNTQGRAVQTLQQADPGFDPAAFSGRVETAFLKLQEGWSAQDPAAIRPFTSDGVLERFSLQFQEQKEEGYRNQMQDISIAGVQIVDARIGPVFHSATLMIRAAAVDLKVDLKTGKRISGETSAEPFVEYWTFVRRPGPAGTPTDPSKPGLLEGQCPNCGAPITDSAASPDASYKCASCGSALLSGTHDWVLAEISQSTARVAEVAGPDSASIANYQASEDPGFSSANLEDRASVTFWRWAKAWRTGTVKPLEKVASPEYCQSVADLMKSQSEPGAGTRRFPSKCAVGSVEALGVIPGNGSSAGSDDGSGDEDTNLDRALVLVEWSGTTYSGPINPKAQAGAKPSAPVSGGGVYCVSLLTLSRKQGVMTNPALGLSSAHCPSCGGPESDNTADACPFCGSILNDGSAGWVLTRMEDSTTPKSRALIAQLNRRRASGAGSLGGGSLGVGSSRVMALWLASAILADDVVTEREHEFFAAFCERQRIPGDQVEAILDTAKRDKAAGNASFMLPESPTQGREWLEVLASGIYASGEHSKEDYQLLLAAARRLNLSEQDAWQAHTGARARILNQAREAIKAQKKGLGSGV